MCDNVRADNEGWTMVARAVLLMATVAAPSIGADRFHGRLFEPLDRSAWPRIVRPTIGLPVIVRPGETFTVVVGSDQQPQRNRCRVALVCCDLRAEAEVVRVRKSRGPAGLWAIEASAPSAATCPLLYDLHVMLSGRSVRQPNAVQVIPRHRDDVTCIQITDTEIDHRNPAPGQRLARAISEINLIVPDFVIASGDLTYDGRPKQFDALVELFDRLEVPLFTQLGNADYHGDEAIYFARVNAYRDYAVDVGRVHLTALDSGTNYKQSRGPYNPFVDNEGTGLSDAQLAWFEADLARAPAGSLRLAFMHFPAVSQFGNRASVHFNRQRFKQACASGGVALVLCGHTHVDSVFDQREKLYMTGAPPETRPCYVQTATTSSQTRAPMLPYAYRLVRMRGRRVVSFTYDTRGNGRPDAMRSVPLGKLGVAFEPPNDGRSDRVTATIKNPLNEAFDRARLTFRLPSKSATTYRVEGARPIGTIPDGSHVRLVVETRVPARSERTVRVKPE